MLMPLPVFVISISEPEMLIPIPLPAFMDTGPVSVFSDDTPLGIVQDLFDDKSCVVPLIVIVREVGTFAFNAFCKSARSLTLC